MRPMPCRRNVRGEVRLRRLAAVGGAALLTTIGLTTGAAARPAATAAAPNPSTAVVTEYSQVDTQQIDAYWTPQRLRDATPFPAPVAPAQQTPASPQAPNQAQSAPGETPASAAPNVPKSEIGTQLFSRAQQWTAHGRLPASSIGRLF